MAYTDLTNEFFTRHGIEWTDLQKLADNDAYNRYPSGTATLFFQSAAPTKWTKSVAQDDKAFRVVSGAGGVSGGSRALSLGIPLAHSHTVNAHTHSLSSHSHVLHFVATTGQGDSSNNLVVSNTDTDGEYLSYRNPSLGGPSRTWRRMESKTKTDGSGTLGSTTPGTDSQLTDSTFAYFDAIVCTKD